MKALSDWLTNRYYYKGSDDGNNGNALPVGLSRVTCTDFIGIAFIDHTKKEVVSMFSLEPGKVHVIKCPEGVQVVVETGEEVEWFVSYSNRFNKSDPTKVESALIRPRTQQEEMQDYINSVAARAMGAEIAQGLRSGTHELSMENDDYSEYQEDDEIAPLTVYQMESIIKVMQSDLAAEIAAQKDIEEEAPPVPLKDGNNTAGTNSGASGSAETGEVEQ